MSKFADLYNKMIGFPTPSADAAPATTSDVDVVDNTEEAPKPHDENVLVRPLNKHQIADLKADKPVVVTVTPDYYTGRFKNLPYSSQEEMAKKKFLYSKTQDDDGVYEYNFNIDQVEWDSAIIKITLSYKPEATPAPAE